jgi:hypothetical protein
VASPLRVPALCRAALAPVHLSRHRRQELLHGLDWPDRGDLHAPPPRPALQHPEAHVPHLLLGHVRRRGALPPRAHVCRASSAFASARSPTLPPQTSEQNLHAPAPHWRARASVAQHTTPRTGTARGARRVSGGPRRPPHQSHSSPHPPSPKPRLRNARACVSRSLMRRRAARCTAGRTRSSTSARWTRSGRTGARDPAPPPPSMIACQCTRHALSETRPN